LLSFLESWNIDGDDSWFSFAEFSDFSVISTDNRLPDGTTIYWNKYYSLKIVSIRQKGCYKYISDVFWRPETTISSQGLRWLRMNTTRYHVESYYWSSFLPYMIASKESADYLKYKLRYWIIFYSLDLIENNRRIGAYRR
jgi:hypothetical protein